MSVSSPPLEFVTFKWGNRYRPRHVNILASMLRRHYQLPHRLTCITDDPAGIDSSIRTMPIMTDADMAMKMDPAYRAICGQLRDSQTMLQGHRPHRTWFGRYPLTQIDYIFLTPQFKVKAIAVPRTALDKMASDHLPLVADLELF